MHAVTSSIFLPTFVRSLSPEHAARLLRDKLAVDLGYFVARGRPELNLDQLLAYKPRKPELVPRPVLAKHHQPNLTHTHVTRMC
jgi:hypothetical protein